MSKVIIFTDGACSGNPGPGGWAAILISPLGKVREIGGCAAHTTNNKMEITAALEALRTLSSVKKLSSKEIQIYTDSKYVIQGITQWVFGWKRNGWKTGEGKDVSNRELWEALLEAARDFKIEWLYVPGHSGNQGNDRCDEIAVAFSKGWEPTLYTGDKASYTVDIDELPEPEKPSSGSKKQKKGPAVYLSYVRGELHRDRDWKSCESRVKGVQGARFKKVESPEEEDAVLKSWGAKRGNH